VAWCTAVEQLLLALADVGVRVVARLRVGGDRRLLGWLLHPAVVLAVVTVLHHVVFGSTNLAIAWRVIAELLSGSLAFIIQKLVALFRSAFENDSSRVILSLLVALLVCIGLLGCLVSSIGEGNPLLIGGPVIVADSLLLLLFLVLMAIEVALATLSLEPLVLHVLHFHRGFLL